jgi:hypothetical protein
MHEFAGSSNQRRAETPNGPCGERIVTHSNGKDFGDNSRK